LAPRSRRASRGKGRARSSRAARLLRQKTVKALKAESGSDPLGFAGNLGTAAAVEELVRRHPSIDILVNNLGIFEPKPFEDIPDTDWMRFFEVNVLSGMRLARSYLPAMKRNNWGRIIFISSESG
jgi:NAD(P)-dependent dehydrogenase (short-subunit alcohol dehydrogenase family)